MGVQEMTLMLRVHPQNRHLPTGRLAQTFQTLNGGGLPGPIWANHAEDLTLLHLKTNLIHSDCRTVSLPKSFNFYNRIHFLTSLLAFLNRFQSMKLRSGIS